MEQRTENEANGRDCGTCRHWRKWGPDRGACTQGRPAIRTVARRLHYCYPITDRHATCEHWALDAYPRLVLTDRRRQVLDAAAGR